MKIKKNSDKNLLINNNKLMKVKKNSDKNLQTIYAQSNMKNAICANLYLIWINYRKRYIWVQTFSS